MPGEGGRERERNVTATTGMRMREMEGSHGKKRGSIAMTIRTRNERRREREGFAAGRMRRSDRKICRNRDWKNV